MACSEKKLAATLLSLLAVALAFCGLTGCAASQLAPQPLTISSADYQRAFDTAVEVSRQESLIGGLRDRRSGIIETEPSHMPTLLEPWHAHGESFNRLVEGTLSMQRRRARFEFAAAGTDQQPDDLLAHDGNLEVRVFVHVERADGVGRRHSTWTRRVRSRERIWDTHIEQQVGGAWVPVGRDTTMEHHLLTLLQSALQQ